MECSGGSSGTGNDDLIGSGFATAEEALADRLGYYEGLYGGEIIELADNEAALQVDGSNVVVNTASAAPDGGGLLVQEDYFCTTTNLNSRNAEHRTTRDVGTEVQSGAVRRSAHFRTTSLEARSSVTESGPSRAPDDPAGKSGLPDLAASR